MDNDLISREALKKKLQARHDNGEEDFDKGYNIGIETAIDLIDNAPTVEQNWRFYYDHGYAQAKRDFERPHGEWIFNKEMSVTCSLWNCSVCNRLNGNDSFNFCPNCGADMRKGGAE